MPHDHDEGSIEGDLHESVELEDALAQGGATHPDGKEVLHDHDEEAIGGDMIESDELEEAHAQGAATPTGGNDHGARAERHVEGDSDVRHGMDDGMLECLRGIQPEASGGGTAVLAVGHFLPLQATAPPTGRDQLRRVRMGVVVPIHDRLGVQEPGTHHGEFTVPHADGNRTFRKFLKKHQAALRAGDVEASLRVGAVQQFLVSLDNTASVLHAQNCGAEYAELQRLSHLRESYASRTGRSMRVGRLPRHSLRSCEVSASLWCGDG